MENYKIVLSSIAIAMAIGGYIPYIRDSIAGRTKPHMFSWFIGLVLSFTAFGLQIQDNAGPGAFVTLSAAIISSIIFALAILNKDKDIQKMDFAALLLSLFALAAWLIAEDPVLSTGFVIIAEVLSFLPTVRKSLHDPYSETLSSYIINFFRFIIALLALNKYGFVAIGYPLTWLILNGGFALAILYWRKSASVLVAKE